MKIRPDQHPPILIMQQNVDYVEMFPNLRSYMSSNSYSEPSVRAWIGNAASIFQRLPPNWSSTTIKLNVKLRLYTSIVIPAAMYVELNGHDRSQARCLPSPLPIFTMLDISWRDHATNEEVTRRADMERIQYTVSTPRRKMASHGRRKRGTEEEMAKHFRRRAGRDGC